MTTTNSLPTVTATISLTLSASVSADIITHWMSQQVGPTGVLASAISETDTTFSLVASRSGSINLAPGNTIVIDNEAMVVNTVDGSLVTVTRNIVPLALPAQAHNAGASASILRYPSAWAVIADEALRPWAQQVVASLGANSATFGSKISGTLAIGE